MAQEIPNQTHEEALSVLEQAKREGTLSEAHRARLVELVSTGENVRESVTDTLEAEEKRELSPEQADELLGTLKSRFEFPENDKLREAVDFAVVEKSLRAAPEKLYALHKLEETGGEPQVIGLDGDEFVFEDRAKQSPTGRRNLNFDQSLAQAEEFGVDMQSPDSYKAMQKTGEYDMGEYSWLKTDPEYRKRTGRAMYGGRDGGGVDVGGYNANSRAPNGGWRASLRVKKV
jgi:hypothetical protein